MNWNKILTILQEGGIITHPTDTCYGLACDPFNEKAARELYELKGMPREKPLTWMVGSMGEAMAIKDFSQKAVMLASECWPGDLTLVIDGQGLRVPGDDFTLELLKRWGGPLITTSANLSGEEAPYSADQALSGDFLVDFGKIPRNKPSRVVRVEGDRVEVLRD
ncbi:MAG: L-threonylcarbamoyladenylate synthase [Patescibacteria group bacterium]|nr:L-threonylcarbamoyladenylate synthase [Patescibacteria group bacterium]